MERDKHIQHKHKWKRIHGEWVRSVVFCHRVTPLPQSLQETGRHHSLQNCLQLTLHISYKTNWHVHRLKFIKHLAKQLVTPYMEISVTKFPTHACTRRVLEEKRKLHVKEKTSEKQNVLHIDPKRNGKRHARYLCAWYVIQTVQTVQITRKLVL
jgi:hypothetical protein